MRFRPPFSTREKIGDLIQENKLVIVLELFVVALFPIFLAMIQTSRTIIPLLLLGWLSLWLRHKNWKEIGLRRPSSWTQVFLTGIILAAVGVYLSEKVIAPYLLRLTGETQPPVVELVPLRGNLSFFLFSLVGIWLLAAVGEELVYRGYVLNRLADLLGRSRIGWGISLVVSSLVFSLGHGIFNRAVIIGGFFIGLFEAILYLAYRRNLWLPIVFHGVWDSIFLTLFFLGMSLR